MAGTVWYLEESGTCLEAERTLSSCSRHRPIVAIACSRRGVACAPPDVRVGARTVSTRLGDFLAARLDGDDEPRNNRSGQCEEGRLHQSRACISPRSSSRGRSPRTTFARCPFYKKSPSRTPSSQKRVPWAYERRPVFASMWKEIYTVRRCITEGDIFRLSMVV